MAVDNLIIHEKPETMFSYLSGEKRLIPDQCLECHHLIKQYDGKKGLYCRNHVSIVDKDTFIQNIYRVYHLGEKNPYKQHQDKCELIDREPQHVIYAETFAGRKTTIKGDGEMLKDQRDRFPVFLKGIQLIIDKESLNVVEKLLNTRGPTIKGWFKGKSNEGTEPTSSDYSLYEERVRSYIAKFENENKIVKQESARDTYLGSIRKVNEFSGYFLSLHPTIEMPKMKELHEGTTRLLSKPDEYEDWNVAASMRSSAQNYQDAVYTEMPEVKEFGLKLKSYEGQLKTASKAADKRTIENNINKYSSLAMNKRHEIEELAKNHLAKGEIKVNVQTDPKADVLGEILIFDILPNPYQPRKIFKEEEIVELAASMKKNGLIQAIVVRRTPEGLVLVAGERRMRAAIKNGWESITAITKTMDEAQAATASIIENFQRKDNNPIEIADAIAAMIERVGVTQQEAAKMIGVTQPKIAQLISLTKLIDPIKDLIISEKMSQSVGRILGSLEEDIQQRMLSSLENMSAEKAQHFVNIYKGLNGIHDFPEVETDAIEIRIFKRLLKSNCVDLYSSAWATLNQGLKTLQLNKVKGFYIPTSMFPQSPEVRSLLQKNKISEYYNYSKKPEFRLFDNMEKTASDITLNILNELLPPKKELNEGQTDIGETIEITPEERMKNVFENVSTFRASLLSRFESVKGTAWELSYGYLVEECKDFEDVDIELEVVEDELEKLQEMLVELNGAFADSDRQKHLLMLKEAFDLAKLNEIKYAGSEHEALFLDLVAKLSDILTYHMKQETYRLGRLVTPLWLQTNELVEIAEINKEPAEEGSTVLETPIAKLPVLNVKPEKSKTNRILQIMQEEATQTHEISVKCSGCQMFNPNGKSYRDRCMSSSISFHSFKRFVVDGLNAFDCSEYTPKLDVIQRKKAAANLDTEVALFEILVYQDGYGRSYPDLSWLKKEIPELRNSSCEPEDVIKLFKQQFDHPTRSYWIEVLFRRYQLSRIVQKDLEHPVYTADGQRFMVNNNSMENDDKI